MIIRHTLKLFCLFLFFFSSSASSEKKNILYLKDGSIINGEVVGQWGERKIIFRHDDGTTVTYDIEDIKDIVTVEKKPTLKRETGEALALSLIPPLFLPIQGGGQIYNKQVYKGLFFYSLGCIGSILVYKGYTKGYFENKRDGKLYVQTGVALYVFSWIWSSIDAYKMAEKAKYIK